jgi:hypothetical protein
MLILPTGGKGIGVEANGQNFPFISPSPDIVGLLADLWLSHANYDAVLPLRVSSLHGFQEAFEGQSSKANITVVDAAGTTVFDGSGAQYQWKDWGKRLRVHEWLFNNPDGSVCRVVQHRATAASVPPWPETITPINGVLDERASELMPKRLLTITGPGIDGVTPVTVTGEVTLVNGWNVDIVASPYNEPLRNTTDLTFSANPGGGAGRYPGCQAPVIGIRTIRGVSPDPHGNFVLSADGCYYARQPIIIGTDGLAVPVLAQLDIGNDCGPCCDCQDYVNVQKAMLNLEAKLRADAALAEVIRDELAADIERWNAAKECRDNQPLSLNLILTNNKYIDMDFGVCNPYNDCLPNITVHITITSPIPWKVVPHTTFRNIPCRGSVHPYQMSQNGNILTANHDVICPATHGRVRSRIVLSKPLPVGGFVVFGMNTVLSPGGDGMTVTQYVNGQEAGSVGLGKQPGPPHRKKKK